MTINDGRIEHDPAEPIQCLCRDCAPPSKPGSPPAETQANLLHRCTNPQCKRYWIFGMFLNTFATGDELEQWLREKNREWQLEKAQ
jgi:hypothetical protein